MITVEKTLMNLLILFLNFLRKNNIDLSSINNVFINQGPGKFTSIRSAISIVKALKFSKILIYMDIIHLKLLIITIVFC